MATVSEADKKELAQLEDSARRFLEGRKDLKGQNCLKEWRLLLTEEELQLAVKATAREIEKRFEGQEIVLTCILKGAAYFTVDVSRELTIPNSLYFIEASSYGNEQSQGKVELLSIIVPSKFKGRKVVLLDELYDNGATLKAVRQKVIDETKLDPADVFTITLMSKVKEIHYPKPDFCAFPYVPDVWVVGYGCDDAQEKRGWTCLFGKPKNKGIPNSEADSMFTDSPEGIQSYLKARRAIVGHFNDMRTKLGLPLPKKDS